MKSRVEIFAANADGKVFVGFGDIAWTPTDPADTDVKFKPRTVHSWLLSQDDGSVLGWQPAWEGSDDDPTAR